MTSVIDKPRIQCQCRYRKGEGWQCPLDALEKEHYCKFQLPK